MKSILDPTFRYTSSAETDLRKTFARVRREQAKAKRMICPCGMPHGMHAATCAQRVRIVASTGR